LQHLESLVQKRIQPLRTTAASSYDRQRAAASIVHDVRHIRARGEGMVMSYGRGNGAEMWQTPEGAHLDVRGLEPPQPMVRILGLIDSGEVGDVLIVHLDREPIFLYPELDDRGWSHEIIAAGRGNPAGEDEVRLQLKRMRP
jgi:Uncharacterized conserved protein (DUF2249)